MHVRTVLADRAHQGGCSAMRYTNLHFDIDIDIDMEAEEDRGGARGGGRTTDSQMIPFTG